MYFFSQWPKDQRPHHVLARTLALCAHACSASWDMAACRKAHDEAAPAM